MTEENTYTLDELKEVLNEKQKIFCHQYVIDWNTTRSYKKAYVIEDDNSAAVSGFKLLRNTKIAQYIDFIKTDYEMLCGISKVKQINEYKKIAYSSIAHLHENWIELIDWEEIKKSNPVVLECIESIDTKTESRLEYNVESEKRDKEVDVKYVKIKLYSKLTALERIDKLMGYNEADKIDHSSKDGSMTPDKTIILQQQGKEIDLKS